MIGDQLFYVERIDATIDVDLDFPADMFSNVRGVERGRTTILNIQMKAFGSPKRRVQRESPVWTVVDPESSPEYVDVEPKLLGEGHDG